MTGRLFSLVAIPLSLVGHLLFWGGSATLLRGLMQFGSGAIDLGALALAVVGMLLVLAALATVAVGSLGALIVGAVHLLFSLLFHVVPFDVIRGGFSPAFEVMNAVRGLSMEVSDGMFWYVPTGVAVVTGAIFVGAALAADGRGSVAPAVGPRLVAAIAGLVGLGGLALAVSAGARVYMRQLIMFSAAEPIDVVLLYLGGALVAGAVLAGRWSTVGAILAGAVVVVAGLVGLASPLALLDLTPSPELKRGVQILAGSGSLLLIGLLLVVAGLAIRWRARRAGTAASPIEATPASAAPPAV